MRKKRNRRENERKDLHAIDRALPIRGPLWCRKRAKTQHDLQRYDKLKQRKRMQGEKKTFFILNKKGYFYYFQMIIFFFF